MFLYLPKTTVYFNCL